MDTVIEEELLTVADVFFKELIDILAVTAAGSYAAGMFHANGQLKAGVSFDIVQEDALKYAIEYRKQLAEKGTISANVPVYDEAGNLVGHELQEVQWLKTKPAEFRGQLSDIIARGIAEGKPTGVRVSRTGKYPKGSIAEEVKELLDDYKSQASTIARTETARCYYNGEFERYSRAGVEYVQFLGAPDACEVCHDYIGKVFKLGEGPAIPVHPNCRCDYRPYFPEPGENINASHRKEGQVTEENHEKFS